MAETAETGGAGAAVVHTRGSIRAFLFGDTKYLGTQSIVLERGWNNICNKSRIPGSLHSTQCLIK